MDTGLKIGTFGHSVLAALGTAYYIYSLCFPFKFDVLFSAVAVVFMALSTIVNLSSFCLASNRKLKSYYLYFLIFQVILSIILAGAAGITIKKEEVGKELSNDLEKHKEKYGRQVGFLKFYSKLQKGFKCCSANDPKDDDPDSIFAKFTKARDLTQEDLKDFINSCCDGEIAQDDLCTDKHPKYNTSSCKEALEKSFNIYKYFSIFVFIMSAIFECSLLFGFYKKT